MQIHITLKKGVKDLFSNTLFCENLAAFSQNIPYESRNEKIALIFARTSALFNLITTYPYQKAYRWLATKIFSERDLVSLFGPSTILECNSYHPRHLFSLLGLLFGLGSFLLIACENYSKGKTNSSLLCFASFNTFSTRSFLHLANRFTKL